MVIIFTSVSRRPHALSLFFSSFLIGINKVQTIVAVVRGGGIVVAPVIVGPVPGDPGSLRVQVAEVVALEDKQRNRYHQRAKQDPHACDKAGRSVRSKHVGTSDASEVDGHWRKEKLQQ